MESTTSTSPAPISAEVENTVDKQVSETYMNYRRQQILLSMGKDLDPGFNKETLDEEFKIAEKAFNQQIAKQIAKEKEVKDKERQKKDFSKYTVEDYEKLTDIEDKFQCFKAMFKAAQDKLADQIGRGLGVKAPIAGSSVKKPVFGSTFKKAAQKMMARTHILIFIGSDIQFENASDITLTRNVHDSKDNQQWAQEFETLQQNGYGANLIRFADYMQAKNKSVKFACSTDEQMKSLRALRQEISYKEKRNFNNVSITHLKTEKDTSDFLVVMNCAILIGNTQQNDVIKSVLSDVLKKQTCPIIDLDKNYESDITHNGFIFQVEQSNDNECNRFNQLVRGFMDHITGKALNLQLRKAA